MGLKSPALAFLRSKFSSNHLSFSETSGNAPPAWPLLTIFFSSGESTFASAKRFATLLTALRPLSSCDSDERSEE